MERQRAAHMSEFQAWSAYPSALFKYGVLLDVSGSGAPTARCGAPRRSGHTTSLPCSLPFDACMQLDMHAALILDELGKVAGAPVFA
jgi:hypothetical protein